MVFVVALTALVVLAVIARRMNPAPSWMQPAPDPNPDPNRRPEDTPPMSAEDTIKQTVTENDVVLFMKGTKMMPQCGFSSRVAGVLNFMGVEFQDVNVLADEEIRQGIKEYSDWPHDPAALREG